MTSAAQKAVAPGRIAGIWRGLQTFVLGTLLCLTAGGSIWVLGWHMGVMRRRAARIAGLGADDPSPLLGAPLRNGPRRAIGQIAGHLRAGILAAISLGLATFPFAVFWMVSWWAGWENSFNKGYEQAFVGPLLGLAGIALFALVMIYLPLALTHQAVEDKALALFDLRRVRSLVMHAGWRYTAFGLAALALALPLFAARGLPVFAEDLNPAIADMSVDDLARLKWNIALLTAAYVFLATTVLRVWSAGIYARAARRALASDPRLWHGAAISDARPNPRGKPLRLTRWLHGTVLFAAWSGLAALIFVGQFLHHEWHVWLTHPFVFLPWGW